MLAFLLLLKSFSPLQRANDGWSNCTVALWKQGAQQPLKSQNQKAFHQYTKHSLSSRKTIREKKKKKDQKTHLLQSECHQPCTITSLYCMFLHCSGLHLKNLSPPAQRTCYVFETNLLLYSPIYAFGTISNNTDINTIEKALLRLVTPSH